MTSQHIRQVIRIARVGRLALIAATLTCVAGGHAAGELGTGPKSGLPVPRFVSLKPDRVNVRGGPTRDHEVTFVYTRSGLPVEITAESDNWRRIRDWEGSEGWVYHSLLSGRRTAVVSPKDKKQLVPLHAKGDANSAIIARLQAGVLTSVRRCDGSWCQIAGSGFDGWVVQEQLWGVYPNEKVE
jgi:SH3-like domain-containing protein